jgi:hypothetical protein
MPTRVKLEWLLVWCNTTKSAIWVSSITYYIVLALCIRNLHDRDGSLRGLSWRDFSSLKKKNVEDKLDSLGFFNWCMVWLMICSACRMWQGFLGSTLSSADLVLFAFYMFVIASNDLRRCLIRHLLSDPTGATMIRTYLTL